MERTRLLLLGSAFAGPLFAIVGLAQAFLLPGFDLHRHALSLLEAGDLGWIQRLDFALAGLLFMGGALALRTRMRGTPGGNLGPRLILVFGLGMLGAGLFTADPGLGYPPGTPADVNAVSWHGIVHLLCATLSFVALTIAGFVWARHFVADKQPLWAAYSVISVVIFFVSFGGLASGQPSFNLAFVLTALHAFIWVSVVSAKILAEVDSTTSATSELGQTVSATRIG
jgi:hypothetical protein